MQQTDFTHEDFRTRRRALAREIGEATALIVGDPATHHTARFRQCNDLYYLCGVEVPQAYLTIDGATGHTTLFLPEGEFVPCDDDYRPLSVDDPAYAAETAGVDAVASRSALWDCLASARGIYLHFLEGEGGMTTLRSIQGARRLVAGDPLDGREHRGDYFRRQVMERFPGASLHDVGPVIYELRMMKSPREVDLLRRAGQLAARGLCEAMRATRPGVMEYQLAAVMQYHYLAGGAVGTSYPPIVAGGRNAFHGHYQINNAPLRDGDLVLADCAPDYRYYTSDITRMWPVNGTFSPAQRALYGFVTEYHKTLLAAIRPGRTCAEIEAEAIGRMRSRVGEFDFATASHATGPEWMFAFGQHLAHSVGLSVHDGLSHKDRPLEPGMVFSVDPQMKIEADRLYLRVEDVGVVTDDGFEVLTRDAPLELDAIEAMMRGASLLDEFPPLP